MKLVEPEIAPGMRPAVRTSHVVAFGLGAFASAVVLWAFGPARPMAEGTLSSVQWMEGEREGRALARRSGPVSIPGGNGSGSGGVDMRGRLYPSHLEISFAHRDVVQIIPMSRLVGVEFGQGGVKTVSP